MSRIFLLFLIIFLSLELKVYSRDIKTGVHIIEISQSETGLIEVEEYIDNGIISKRHSRDTESVSISPSVTITDKKIEEIEIRNAAPTPLLIFEAGMVREFEESLNEDARIHDEMKLREELDDQILSAMFQVPFWIYIGASELPFKRIDFERAQLIPHETSAQFPAMNYSGRGEFPAYRVKNHFGNSVDVVPDDDLKSGEGSGITFSYLLDAPIEKLSVSVSEDADIVVVYCNTSLRFIPESPLYKEVEYGDLIVIFDTGAAVEDDSGLFSVTSSQNDNVKVTRTVIIPDSLAGPILLHPRMSLELSKKHNQRAIPLIALVLIFWLLFAVFVVFLAKIFSVSEIPGARLFIKAMTVYPLYIAMSLLFSGLLGIGFILGAVGCSAIISGKDRLLPMAGVILGASFLVSGLIFFI